MIDSSESNLYSREILEEIINQYLDALASKTPSRLPLSDSVQFVENNQLLEIGDGT